MTPTSSSSGPDSSSRAEEKRWLLGGYAYLVPVAIVFSAGGVVFAVTQFPDIAMWRMVLGGTLFGLFCTGCVAGARMF